MLLTFDSIWSPALLNTRWNTVHISSPMSAMIRTAIAVEITPSPRSSVRRSRTPSFTSCHATSTLKAVSIWSSLSSLSGAEGTQRFDEGHGQEQRSGHEGGDRDGDPD